ncbi:MAG: Glycine betaine/choline-binding protein of an ABC-type transport system, partial [Frankiales bacterium]|nr:Glycine betaine/choline-binding protein of an ABC-type transport system [Frankiales bacterium]
GSGTLDKAKSSAGNELVVLADDQHLQTVDNVVPVVNAKVDTPPLEQALNAVSKVLTTDDLLTMNKSADIDRKSPASVATTYVDDKKLATGVSGGSGKVVVGGANFNESQILANIYAEVLKAAGFDASVKPVTNREVYEPALERGDIQVFPEYAGTLTEFLNKKENGPNATPLASTDITATVTALRGLADKKGLKVLDPAQAADQNAFAVTKTFATDNGLHTLSDLKNYKGNLVLGGPPECPTRPFCQLGLEKVYGLHFSSFISLDTGGPLTKAALKQGKIQIGLVFSSDSSLSTLG